jgi:hypothetical protein
MRVRALKPRITIFGPFVPPRIYDIPADIAAEWIERGYAEPVETDAVPTPRQEETSHALARDSGQPKRTPRKRRGA